MAMTFTYDNIGRIRKVTASWTSDGDGDASGTTAKLNGYLLRAVTVPSATAAPTDDYDITITDEASVNVLAQCQDDLADRDTSTTEQVYFFLKNYDATPVGVAVYPCVNDALTIAVANAGASKAGTLHLYYEYVLP